MDYSNSQFNDKIKFDTDIKRCLVVVELLLCQKKIFAKPSFIISPILVQRIKGSTFKKTRKWIEYVVNNCCYHIE